VIAAERHRGSLPPGDLGVSALRDICRSAEQVVNQALQFRTTEQVTTDVALDVDDGRRLTGRVAGLYGDTLVRVTYSRLNAKHALALWLDLLVLQATDPGIAVAGIVVAKDGQGRIKPVDPDLARSTLGAWARIRHEGLQRLCHLPLETGRGWALGRGNQSTAWRYAMKKWAWDNFRPERDDMAWTQLLGPQASLDRLPDLAQQADAVWRNLVPFERGWVIK
jgi:exodeoxyribonuclease V gamma subunit